MKSTVELVVDGNEKETEGKTDQQHLMGRKRNVRIGCFGWVAGRVLFSAAKMALTCRERAR